MNSIFLLFLSALPLLFAADCGPLGNNQHCSDAECCSQYGFCGTTADHCGTGCNSSFGLCGTTAVTQGESSNDADTQPSIEDVQPDPRVITRCQQPNTLAITFDDGPGPYTSTLLDTLERLQIKATFFINGKNEVDATEPQYQQLMQRMFRDGHQVASHTLTHADLSIATDDKIRQEMQDNEAVIMQAINKKPKFMRPPYGNVNAHTVDLLTELGYRVVNWSADTKDYEHDNADTSAQLYQQMVNSGGGRFVVLEHDIMKSTASTLMDRMVRMVQAKGWRMITVAECVGDSPYA